MAAFIPGGQVFLPLAITMDIGWMGNVAMNWNNITNNGTGFDWGKFGSFATIGALQGAAMYTGNPYVAIASGIASASANTYVAQNYHFTNEVLYSGLQGGFTSAVTLGLSNVGLDRVSTKAASSMEFNLSVSQRIGDFTLNLFADFTTSTTSDAIFNHGQINWWNNFRNASFSAGVSLGTDLAKDATKPKEFKSSADIDKPTKIKSPEVKPLDIASPQTKELPKINPSTGRYTNKGMASQPIKINVNKTSKSFYFDPLKMDRINKPKK